MILKSSGLVFVLVIFLSPVLAQHSHLRTRPETALKKTLPRTLNDSVQLGLQYASGDQEQIIRSGYWDSLLIKAIKFKLTILECRILNKLGKSYMRNPDFNKAVEYFTKAATLAEEKNYKPELMEICGSWGQYYTFHSNPKKALEFYYKQLKLAEELNSPEAKSAAYIGISTLYFFMREYRKSLQIELTLLKRAISDGNDLLVADLLTGIGSNYAHLHDRDNAIKYYMESAKYVDKVGPKAKIQIYNSVGSAYQQQGQLDSAYKFYLRSYQICESMKERGGGFVSTVSLLSRINHMLGNLKTAEKLALEGLKVAKTTEFTEEISRLSFTLKEIYLANNNYKDALRAFETHLKARDSISNEKNKRIALQKEFNYAFEKKTNENKLLLQRNQIQSLKLRQNNYFLLAMGIGLLLVFIIAYLFIRQNKIKAEQQRSLLEQKLLRSQMNPHFIFNSLQSIQNFILKRNEKEAVKYLSSFAAVTRNVLENSRMELISLKKEIALLENYLQLQKLRFKNRFNYEIRVDAGIDTEHITIPPMLCQPFIENAVEHGFHDLLEGGRITVSYVLKNDKLLLKITDNGAGMKNSYSESKQHQSLALEITKERVALMNRKLKEKTVFVIGEAFPLNSERKGVEVNFSLPLNFKI